jgi:cell division protein FtsI/penicillin-binding protein 2
LGSLTRLYHKEPEAIDAFVGLKKELIGKTSTAESMENLNLDLYRGTNRYNHVWFGGISFDRELDAEGFLSRDQKGKPELVVVVFLRYGSFGKEAAPIAAQVVKKWREIKARHYTE